VHPNRAHKQHEAAFLGTWLCGTRSTRSCERSPTESGRLVRTFPARCSSRNRVRRPQDLTTRKGQISTSSEGAYGCTYMVSGNCWIALPLRSSVSSWERWKMCSGTDVKPQLGRESPVTR
jgi:hypothetical protein